MPRRLGRTAPRSGTKPTSTTATSASPSAQYPSGANRSPADEEPPDHGHDGRDHRRERREDAHRTDREARVEQRDGDRAGDARRPRPRTRRARFQSPPRNGAAAASRTKPVSGGDRGHEHRAHPLGGEPAEEVGRAEDECPGEREDGGEHGRPSVSGRPATPRWGMPHPPPGGVRPRAGGAPPGRVRAVRLGWSGDDSGRTRSARNGDRRVRDLRGVPRAHPRRRHPARTARAARRARLLGAARDAARGRTREARAHRRVGTGRPGRAPPLLRDGQHLAHRRPPQPRARARMPATSTTAARSPRCR